MNFTSTVLEMDREFVAIIPARGGSKGIPLKNLRLVGGLPLIARSIAALRASSSISEIYVSTDCAEISRVSAEFGAKVIERPPVLAIDEASTDPVLLHALEAISKHSPRPDQFVLAQATFPFLNNVLVDRVCEELKDPYDCAFAATPFHSFVWSESEENSCFPTYRLQNHKHHFHTRPRRQDSSIQYLEQGSVYAIKTQSFLSSKSRFCFTPRPVVVDTPFSFEIDTPGDLYAAKNLAQTPVDTPNRIDPSRLRVIVCDIDGVLTDNKVFTGSNGVESVRFNKSDSLAISLFKSLGVTVVWLTSEVNPTHKHRAKKLGLQIVVSPTSKEEALSEIIKTYNRTFRPYQPTVVYIGNDLNDVKCLTLSDLSCCPLDSHPSILQAADLTLPVRGGEGVFRALSYSFGLDVMPETPLNLQK